MAGHEGAGLRVVTVRQRDARIGGNARGRRDAGYNLERDAVPGEGLDLLAAAPEDERVAALEAQHALAFLGEPHQQFVDFFLRHGVVGALLADENVRRVAPRHCDDGFGHQVVVEHHVGLLHQAQGA